MIKLIKPLPEHKEKYKDMIKEWQEFGGPYVPCIIEYDCSNPVEELDYDAVLKVVDDYSKGIVFDYDVEYFESSDFYFIFDKEKLIGMAEIRHNLKPLGINTIGHLACGIRPSERQKGYALKATECMIEQLKEDGVNEVILCHYSENNISPKILEKLNFEFKNIIISEVSKKEIKRYVKSLVKNYE